MRAGPTEAFIWPASRPPKSPIEPGSFSVSSSRVSASPAPRSRTSVPAVVAAALVVSGLAAFVLSSGSYVSSQPAAEEPYNQVVEGFRSGHVWMAKEAPPELVASPHPYAFSTYRQYLGAPWRVIDLSYYHGHLYAYFGVTPAVILFWPWRVLTGGFMRQSYAVLAFCVVGYAMSVGLAVALWRRYFPQLAPWVGAAAAVLLGSATTLPVFVVRPGLYEVAIACAYMMTMLCLVALWRCWHRPEHGVAWLAAASLAFGLAVGARPTLLFGAVILLTPVAGSFVLNRYWLRLLLAAVLPLAAVGAGLAAYNDARFGNPLQFGHDYQLSGNDVFGLPSFGLRFFWDNVRLYFLEPLRWHAGFPWVWKPSNPPLAPGHLPVEFFFGTLTNLPILLAACLVPLAGLGARRGLGGMVLGVGLLFLATTLPICFYAGATSRYLLDFLPALALLALVGFLGLECVAQAPAADPDASAPMGTALAPVLRGALVYSAVVVWLLAYAISSFYRSAEEGTQLLLAGKIDEAIPVFARVDAINPNSGGLSDLAIANALVGANRLKDATQYLRAAVDLSPGLEAAHFSLGRVLLQENDARGADRAFRRALALDPTDEEAETGLAIALLRENDPEGADAHAIAALKLRPDDPVAHDLVRIIENAPALVPRP